MHFLAKGFEPTGCPVETESTMNIQIFRYFVNQI